MIHVIVFIFSHQDVLFILYLEVIVKNVDTKRINILEINQIYFGFIKIKAIDSDEINKTKLENERREHELKANIREEIATKMNIEKMIDNFQKNVENLQL